MNDLLKEQVTCGINHSGWFCKMIHWKDLAQKNDSFTNQTLLLLSWTLQMYTEWQPHFWSECEKMVTEFTFLNFWAKKKKTLIFVYRIKLFSLPVNYRPIYIELAVPCLFLCVYVCVRQAERPQIKTESNLAWLNPVWPDLHPVCPHCSALTILLLLNHSRKSCTMSTVNTHTGIYSALEFFLPPFHSLLHTYGCW